MKQNNFKGESLQFSGKLDLAPAPESTDHVEIKKEYQLFIDGKFSKPSSGNYFPSINPANEKQTKRMLIEL